ncbi:MAG: hypothetical protein HQ565_09170 [Bacteroidetes bacterium]|nr:hypothetical protein [Bacteroidota bacterium]
MTKDQLKEIMKFQLSNFNDEGVPINNQTVHNAVLSEDDGFGHVNSVQLYKDVIKFVLVKQGHKLKKWPSNWLEMDVDELSSAIYL